MTRPEQSPTLPVRVAWLLVLFTHIALAGLALWLLPHGFPVMHRRTVLGTFAPVGIAAGSLALAAAMLRAPRIGARFVPVLPAFWASAALGLLLVFPQTGHAATLPLGVVALVLALLSVFTCRHYPLWQLLPALLLGAAAGQVVAHCERPSSPSTHLSPWAPPPREAGPSAKAPEHLELTGDLLIEGSQLRVTWHGPQISISIAPVLEFGRTPADGFWSRFAAAPSPPPHVLATPALADSLALWTADGTRSLNVTRYADEVRLEAWTVLAAPVYSHLNSFTTVEVRGHQRLGLRFSPCPSTVIAVTHADYPTGAPARFAYVDAAWTFHVMAAASGEKGPFVPLAAGPLPANTLLGIDLVELGDRARTFARLEFADFEAQSSKELSPTAGGGVTENAIEFGLAEPAANSPAQLLFTLASTGIGRGWDSVGHRAGAYYNRVSLRSFDPPVPAPNPPRDDVAALPCDEIARDIVALKPKFPQLAAFDPALVYVGNGVCHVDYDYRTHSPTHPGGWAAQVPEPDAGGLWFHVGIWDRNGPERTSQINTQAGWSVYEYRDTHKNITVLIRDGLPHGRFPGALWDILSHRGLGKRVH